MKRWFLLSVCGVLLLTLFLPFQAAAADSGSAESSNSNVAMVAAGGGHTLALKRDGTVWTWGNNAFGQLGYGGPAASEYTPVHVRGLQSVTAVAAGFDDSMALKSDGTVWAWGNNNSGQLGSGSTSYKSYSPVQVAALSSVVAIASGNDHNLAVTSDGTVWAWGENRFGVLGDGTTTSRNTPVQVQGLQSVIAVAAGGLHNLALKSDGTVWTWGSNSNGQLGDGTTTDRYVPVQVPGLQSVTGISAGDWHSLALKNDGTVWAWGNNAAGKLGNGTTEWSASPVQAAPLDSVTAVAAGRDHSMALKSDGTVWAWGENNFGQLGDGSAINRSSPVRVTDFGSASFIAADGSSLAVRSDGTLWGWGFNGNGELADGTNTNRFAPVQAQAHWRDVPESPQWPQGEALTVTDVTYNSVQLNWQPAEDETGVDKYEVYAQSRKLAVLNGDVTSYAIKELTPDSNYVFSVIAFDAAGNQSEKKEVLVTTAPITTPGSLLLSDSKTYSDGVTTYQYSLYYGYISSPGQVLSGSWTPPEGYHGVVDVSMLTADGADYDLILETVNESGYHLTRQTKELPDGTESSGAGVPIGEKAVWKVKGHTDQDYGPARKVLVYVSIHYDNR